MSTVKGVHDNASVCSGETQRSGKVLTGVHLQANLALNKKKVTAEERVLLDQLNQHPGYQSASAKQHHGSFEVQGKESSCCLALHSPHRNTDHEDCGI